MVLLHFFVGLYCASVETPIKCFLVLIACLSFPPSVELTRLNTRLWPYMCSLLANMDPASLPASSSIEGAILLKAYYKLHHCVTLFLSLPTHLVPFTLLYGTFVLQ